MLWNLDCIPSSLALFSQSRGQTASIPPRPGSSTTAVASDWPAVAELRRGISSDRSARIRSAESAIMIASEAHRAIAASLFSGIDRPPTHRFVPLLLPLCQHRTSPAASIFLAWRT